MDMLVRGQAFAAFNESSLADGSLKDVIGGHPKWLSISNSKNPFTLKEKAATKKQLVEQATPIKKL